MTLTTANSTAGLRELTLIETGIESYRLAATEAEHQPGR